jgi:hypothetical protein
MHNMQAIQVQQVEFEPDLAATIHIVPGQLAPTSRKTYLHDARHFARWMRDYTLSLQMLSRKGDRPQEIPIIGTLKE